MSLELKKYKGILMYGHHPTQHIIGLYGALHIALPKCIPLPALPWEC